MTNDFLDGLNPSQRAAVECTDAASLVIAGAGSGKTRVLTYKIAHLMELSMEPWNILALTFTNKAAREMRERIGRLVGEEKASALWMGTFHSIFSRILRIESATVGFSSNFTIYDASDSQSMVKNIIKEMGLDDKKYRPGVVANRISEAKNELIVAADYAQDRNLRTRDDRQKMPNIHEIYTTYQNRLRQSDAMDFDDLLLYTYLLLRDHPEIRQKYEDKFHYVLVDEYQDTNYAQHQIVWLLTEHRQRVSVVGDDAQSIYSFRGARIDNILNFQQLYANSRLFKLEQNYRSTQNIVRAANSLISYNQKQIFKDVFSENEEGDKIHVLEAYSDKEEASIVARKIGELMRSNEYNLGNIAVLYRTNAQSRVMEEEFRRRGFKYHIYGGLSFYQRKEIKDAIAYLRLAVNPHDEESLRRVINYPARGLGKTTLDKLFRCALDHQVSPFDVLCDTIYYGLDVNGPTHKRLQEFAHFIMSCNQATRKESAHPLAMRIMKESGMAQEIMQSKEKEDVDRQQNLQELMDAISSFEDETKEEGRESRLSDFLQEVALISDLDNERDESLPSITMMTVHSAKGLEFPVVFVVGLEQNLFPSEMAVMEHNVEEERRLCYVAMTRAEEKLFLSWSHSRMRFGKFENNECSQFLKEIDSGFMSKRQNTTGFLGNRVEEERPARPTITPNRFATTPRPAQPAPQSRIEPQPAPRFVRPVSSVTSQFTSSTPLPKEASGLQVGSRIEHSRFGIGTVTKIEGTGLDTKATVEFENMGAKQLLLRFAKFTVLQ